MAQRVFAGFIAVSADDKEKQLEAYKQDSFKVIAEVRTCEELSFQTPKSNQSHHPIVSPSNRALGCHERGHQRISALQFVLQA